MRIVSGKFKGMRISAPKAIRARPTTDFAKEALFNILEYQAEITDAEILDLFAGTGNISYEFASRGAASITSVDFSLASYRFINSYAMDNDMPIKAIKQDVFKHIKKDSTQYDIIFADPPYALKNIPEISKLILESTLLKPDGILIVEHGEENDLRELPNHIETRVYGRVHFAFFSHTQMKAV
jgi:16S rRNA (guanine966-N2)-methyltransferase